MTLTIQLDPKVAEQLRQKAAQCGQETEEYVKALVERQARLEALQALAARKPTQALSDLKPRIPTPPGTNALELIMGQWPGEESDAEIDAALEALS